MRRQILVSSGGMVFTKDERSMMAGSLELHVLRMAAV